MHKKTKNINYKAYSENKQHHQHRVDAVFINFNMQLGVDSYVQVELKVYALLRYTYYDAHAFGGSFHTLLFYNTGECT